MLNSDLSMFISNFMIQLIYLLMLSAINQVAVNQLKIFVPSFDDGSISKAKATIIRKRFISIITIIISLIETINLKLDLTFMFNDKIEFWGQFITGIVLSSGTSGLYRLMNNIKQIKDATSDSASVKPQ